MLQQDEPRDYVLATGVQHTVREFVELAFDHCGLKLDWQGTGVDEKGVDSKTGRVLVDINKKYFRPTEVQTLLGDPSLAEKELGWTPTTTFNELVTMMVENDLVLAGLDLKEITRA